MARDVDGLDKLVSDGFARYLIVDILHGTDKVATELVEDWSLPGDLDRDPKTTGKLRITHVSEKGESWVPKGAQGILSPYRATLLLTEVISGGTFERRVQLGLFDVVAVPFAQDVIATVGARWVEMWDTIDDVVPVDDLVPVDDEVPGEYEYLRGYLTGGHERVVATVIDVEVESLDGRVLGASLRSPRTSLTSAVDEWRAIGILPVTVNAPDVEVPASTWVAKDGSRLDAVQTMARALGGVPVVDSVGQWTLADGNTPVVTLYLGEDGTVVDLSSGLTIDGFANVVIGDYEDEAGNAYRAEWVAPGLLSPAAMGREIVYFRTSDTVRSQLAANADVAAIGDLLTSREVDVEVSCVYNPILELGDHVTVPGEDVHGIAVKVNPSSDATMTVTVRMRRAL